MSQKILLVDDEPDVVELIGHRLKASGYSVIKAFNGVDGLSLAKKERPDLIILDVMMPKLDGFNVCRMLKYDEKYKAIPIILLTAKDQEDDRAIGKEILADAYLVKPLDWEALLKKIRELIPQA